MRRGASRRSGLALLAGGLALALLVVALLAPRASDAPDGLERVAEDEGFADRASERRGPLAGYAIPGVDGEAASTILAGAVGVLAAAAIALLAGLGLRARARRAARGAAAEPPADAASPPPASR